jgi:hypothetical protein
MATTPQPNNISIQVPNNSAKYLSLFLYIKFSFFFIQLQPFKIVNSG